MARLSKELHDEIMQRVTENVFEEYGLRGSKQYWFDDQHWYTIRIEFFERYARFPQDRPQGCCVYVAVIFHWDESGTGLDISGSVFYPFKGKKRFENDVELLAKRSLKSTLELRQSLSNLKTARKTMLKSKYYGGNAHRNYHLGIICGLNGLEEEAIQHFDSISNSPLTDNSTESFKKKAAELKTELKDLDGFRRKIDELVSDTREEMKIKQLNWPDELKTRVQTPVLFAQIG